MVAISSSTMPLGSPAPSFSLVEPFTGKVRTLEDLRSSIATVVLFICNHCPYVIAIRDKLAEVAQIYTEQGVQFIAINSNDPEQYPDDSPAMMKKFVEESKFSFPYLFDADQTVARKFGAACTPEFFIFDKDLNCVYRGQFDDSRPKNQVLPTGADLRHALDAMIQGKSVDPHQKPSMGCNIKWRFG